MSLATDLFKWQFHILIVIIIVQVFTKIVHGQKIDNSNLTVLLMVLLKM